MRWKGAERHPLIYQTGKRISRFLLGGKWKKCAKSTFWIIWGRISDESHDSPHVRYLRISLSTPKALLSHTNHWLQTPNLAS
jgi:hypothetical protein